MPDPVAPSMPAPPTNVPPGPTGQATTPPDQAGRRMQAHVQANIGLNALERAAGLFGGSISEEGRELLSVVVKLRKKFGGADPNVQKQELKMMGEGVGPVQQPNAAQGQNLQSAIKAKQASQGMPEPMAAA